MSCIKYAGKACWQIDTAKENGAFECAANFALTALHATLK